jgi:hypothetical protein
LDDFHIFPIGFQNGGKRVAERMPRDFLRDPEFLGCWLDVVPHYGAEPNGLLAPFRSSSIRIGSPHKVRWTLVRRDVVPGQKIASNVFVNRHQFSGSLGLDWSHMLIHQRPGDADMQLLEIEIAPL